MKVLQCVGDINPALGGSVEAARQLSLALGDLGHEPELVTLAAPRPEWVAQWHGPVHYAGPATTYYLYSRRLHGWIAESASRYDAIVIHGLWRYTSVGVWRGLRARGVPYFVFPHGMLDPYFKHSFRWKHIKKSLCWLAGESSVVGDARAVLFTCEEERRRARLTFPRYRCRERVVGLGIRRPQGDPGLERQAFLSAYPALGEKRVVLFLGRLHPKKGCDLLLEGFAQVALSDSRLHLVMAGPDEYGWRSDLERLAARLGIGRQVTWTGPLYGDLKWGALRSAEVFVLPSHTENFGISVVEALACGVPVLISDEVNIWREIESGAGFAARPDAAGAAALLARWIQTPAEERTLMKAAALRCFSERFELERFARGFVECVEGI